MSNSFKFWSDSQLNPYTMTEEEKREYEKLSKDVEYILHLFNLLSLEDKVKIKQIIKVKELF